MAGIRHSRGREGMALAMAIVITAVCITIVTGLIQYIISEYHSTHVDWQRIQALYCAEAGIEYAVEAIRIGAEVPADETTLESAGVPGAEGSFRLSSAPVMSAGVADPDGAVQVTATGYVPSEADVLEGKGAERRVVVVVSRGVWDFGTDAVRARGSVEYGSNDNLTVVVDDENNIISDASVDAGIRVTGTGATIGSVRSVASNDAHVAGTVSAPADVDILPGSATSISGNNPDNYVGNAFPDAASLGYDGGSPAQLVWPPASGTWAEMFYSEAVAGGTVTWPDGTIQGPAYIELYGTGTLEDVTLKGPGTIFVHGNLGGGITNGYPPAQVVASGTLYTNGSETYRCDPGAAGTVAPPLILFGRDTDEGWSAQIRGNSTWDLKGPLLSLHPDGEVLINDSAIGLFGAVIANGTVYFKSNKGGIGFPQFMSDTRYTVRSLPAVRSYAAQ